VDGRQDQGPRDGCVVFDPKNRQGAMDEGRFFPIANLIVADEKTADRYR